MKSKGALSTSSNKNKKAKKGGSSDISSDSSPPTLSSSSSSSSVPASVPVGRPSVKDIQNEAKAASTRAKYIGSYKRFHAWLLIHHPRLILEALPIGVTDSVYWNWKGINWESVDWDNVITGYLEFITFNEKKQEFFLAGIHMYMYLYI